MKRVKKINNSDLYLEMTDIVRIGNLAVKEAKDENRKLGIPETFWKNGIIYYVLNTGEISSIQPDIMK